MFGGKKKPIGDPPKRKGADLMNQMGLGIPGDIGQMEDMYGDVDGDDDLEAELAALTAGSSSPPRTVPPPKRKGPAEVFDIDKMVSESLRDYTSDEELSDTEDSDLLAELNDLTTEEMIEDEPSPRHSNHALQTSPSDDDLTVITDRISLYTQASANAKAVGDTSKQRRLDRGLKTLNELYKKAKSGKPIDKSDIPPFVVISSTTISASQPEHSPVPKASPVKRPSPELSTSQTSVSPTPAKVPAPVLAPVLAPVAVPRSSQIQTESPVPRASQIQTESPVPRASQFQTESPVPRTSQFQAEPLVPTVAPPSTSTSEPVKPGGSVSLSSSDAETRKMLISRREQYKHAAVVAKRNNDMKTAASYVKILKQFDSVIHAVEDGKAIDLSKMPPPPPSVGDALSKAREIASPKESRFESLARQGSPPGEPEPDYMPPALSAEEEKHMFNAPDAPRTIDDALQQRLEKYKAAETEAKNAGESGKARRMGRIVKQYQDAIKAHKAGKNVAYDELPTPPGYAPIPIGSSATAPPAATLVAPGQQTGQPGGQRSPSPSNQRSPRPQPAAAPRPQPAAAAAPHVQPGVAPVPAPREAARPKEYSEQQINRLASQRKSHSTRSQQQETFLRERYAEFKQAALAAKKNTDIELAKKYIRLMKGLEPMIQACEGGFPVDLSQVPPSPNQPDEGNRFVIVSPDDCTPTGDRTEVFEKLETALKNQIRTCAANAQHFSKLGDVPSASKFQKLEANCRKDLDALKNASQHGDPVPKFHYETRSFSMVRTNTELGDGEMELTIVRGIQFHLPNGLSEKDMDTYVKCELPYPTEEPQEKKSDTVKNTINPEYEETFMLQINRKARSFVRVVERKGIKLEVFYKRGFLKSDKLLGSVNVKLIPLENQCTLHDSFDLMDGRKSVGGKLEVKVRVRDPFKNKQVDEVKEKWLIVDQFLRTQASVNQSQKSATSIQRQKSEGSSSMEVLRYEKQQLDKQIFALKDSLSLTQTQALKHKSILLQEKIEMLQKRLREGGTPAWKAYMATVIEEIPSYEMEARQYAKLGDMQKAQVYLTKKKMAEKELAAIKQKFPTL